MVGCGDGERKRKEEGEGEAEIHCARLRRFEGFSETGMEISEVMEWCRIVDEDYIGEKSYYMVCRSLKVRQ